MKHQRDSEREVARVSPIGHPLLRVQLPGTMGVKSDKLLFAFLGHSLLFTIDNINDSPRANRFEIERAEGL